MAIKFFFLNLNRKKTKNNDGNCKETFLTKLYHLKLTELCLQWFFRIQLVFCIKFKLIIYNYNYVAVYFDVSSVKSGLTAVF